MKSILYCNLLLAVFLCVFSFDTHAAERDVESLRTWIRITKGKLVPEEPRSIPLRFAFDPRRRVGFLPAEGTEKDFTAEGYEVVMTVHVKDAARVDLDLCGSKCVWDAGTQTLADGTPFPAEDSRLELRVTAQADAVRICKPDGSVVSKRPGLVIPESPKVSVGVRGGEAMLVELKAYGLRAPEISPEAQRLVEKALKDDRIFYRSDSYTVYAGWVDDKVYGPPPAAVPEPGTIVSPTRVIEGFCCGLPSRWREGELYGRIVDRETVWHPHEGIERFPTIRTGWPTVDAACRVALDVLHRCSTDEFARSPGQVGSWQAGFHMGRKAGFGVWTRDTAHIALRAGNLIDPEIARHSLRFTLKGGIDNGSDGPPMPIVGLWDNYLATGDLEAIREAWPNFKKRIAMLDGRFVPEKGLVKAAHSTSNDFFSEPHAGGFALGTEPYIMQAYLAMARLGMLLGEPEEQIREWQARGELLRENIRKMYWNDEAGIFTTGPEGSRGHKEAAWETAGEEAAVWPRFGIADSKQRRRVLENLPKVAMNEFGVNVFPYRKDGPCHFRGAAWVAWTAGIAEAAGREGRLDLLQQLIAQQVRQAVLHKTFFEVIDYKSGRSWRWPGQLWDATAFLSYFYFGVLGMEYDEEGLRLYPAVPQVLSDMEVDDFRYRKALLQIRVKGWGTRGDMYLDGKQVKNIPTDLEGEHTLEIRMSGKE